MQEEDLSRLEMLLGEDGVNKLKAAHFAVVGLGGVGGYAVEAVARFGIGNITLIDADIVDRSNLNRQLCALNSTVGQNKVDVWASRIQDINPDCNVISLKKFISEEDDFDALFQDVDFTIEAIDTVSSKIALISYLIKADKSFVSCMGAALRQDPSKIKIAKFSQTSVCPLAAKIRKELRARRIPLDFCCVYSEEKPKKMDFQGGDKNQIGKSPLGSSATIPAICGLFAANEAVRQFLL
ncbi:MAG: ThiF family adenylyltransferase [Alphaproteobacteria bacterium]